MGDRATVLFNDGIHDVALVYSHDNGSDMPSVLEEFYAAEDANSHHDNRYDDPEYLAARFVVFLSQRSGPRGLGVGIGNPALSYDGTPYRVLCTQDTRPRIATL